MDGLVVGRDAVLERAWGALDEPGAVLLEGPAGIGKTAVWRALLARAADAGWRVLACAPTESETALPLAALGDLLGPLGSAVPDLPGPQRQAAEAVLLSSDSAGPVDERTLGAAVRTLLDTASREETRVLVAVDDAPWLDPPSERALRFALRRVSAEIAILVARRTGTDPGMALGLDRAPGGDRIQRIELEPLGVGALHHLLADRLGRTLSRPLLARIARDSGGNPLLAIELARAVLRLPRMPLPSEDLPVASSIQELLADALTALPEESRYAVRLAALLAIPTLRDLVAAGVAPHDLDPAEEAGLLAVTPSSVEFSHPVYAAAVRAGIPPGVGRRLHRTLADVVADRDERARHLAQCTVDPDAAVARELADAAERQRARGAPELAAELHQRAAELTPDDAAVDRDRRRVAAVQSRFDSGDYVAAATAADEVAAEATGDPRAESLLVRSMVAWFADDTATALASAEEALACAQEGTRLAGRIHAHLSLFVDAADQARQHADIACHLLTHPPRTTDRGDGGPATTPTPTTNAHRGSSGAPTPAMDPRHAEDRGLVGSGLLMLFIREVQAGEAPRLEVLEQALELEGDEPSLLAGTVPAVWWEAVDDHDRARARLHWMLDRAVARGDEPSQHEALVHLGQVELLAGRWLEAERHITAGRILAEQLGKDLTGEIWMKAMLNAHRGNLTEAERVAEQLKEAEGIGGPWLLRMRYRLEGFTALSAGRMAEASAAYGALAASSGAAGRVEPITSRVEPDWIEACVGAGDLETAQQVLDRLTERHNRLPRPWTTLGLARSTVLIRSATGEDTVDAVGNLIQARAAIPETVIPLDRARCLLVAGMSHRRARRKRQAREALTAAAAEFDTLGAAAFAARTREELARIGGRPPAPLDLTATEDQVARLAAQGRTNRLIADALFISPKTVEANLARVYRKLGISSRAELGTALIRRETPDSSAAPSP